MAGDDRKDTRRRQGNAEWFIDFEQGDLDVEAVTKRVRRRSGQTGTAKPQRDAQPGTTGPSPWVRDFLLNQVEEAPSVPSAVRRKPSHAKAEGEDQGSLSARRETRSHGGTGASRPASAERHANGLPANGLRKTPEAMPQATPQSPPPVIGRAKAGVRGHGTRPFALTGALVLGLAGGLLALPAGNRWNTSPDMDGTRSAQAVPEPSQPHDPPVSREAWRDLPVQASATLPSEVMIRTQASSASTAVVDRGPVEIASVASAPPVVPSATPPASIEASPPSRTEQSVRPTGPTVTPVRAAVEVTARGVDEEHAVAAAPSSVRKPEEDVQAARAEPAPQAPRLAPPSREAIAASREEPKAAPLRNPPHVARRNDKRWQAVRPASSRVAQAAQPRAFALPAVLRPTSF